MVGTRRFLAIGFVVIFTVGAQATEVAPACKSSAIASTPICSETLADITTRNGLSASITKMRVALHCRCCGWTTEQGNDGKSHRVCIHQCCDD